MNKEIIDKVEEIINYIEKSSNYQKYLLIQEKIKDDQEINDLQEEIRVLQKLIANNKKDQGLKDMLDFKNDLLRNIPLYREYLNTIDEINNIFNIIENELNNYFDKIVN